MCGGDVRTEELDPDPRWKSGENLLDGNFRVIIIRKEPPVHWAFKASEGFAIG